MFITGYASQVWVQREQTILGPSIEPIRPIQRLSLFSMQATPKQRLTRLSPANRVDAFKSLQSTISLKLKFELRLTNPIFEIFRSLLSYYDQATQTNYVPLEAHTWLAELTDQVNTLKFWIQDQRTGEGYLLEGCAVSEAEITGQSRQIASVTFGLVALKATYSAALPIPVVLDNDLLYRHPIITGPGCGAFFTDQQDFGDDKLVLPNARSPFLIPGATLSMLRISRDLAPAGFQNGQATRFTKTPAVFQGSVDARINSELRSYLSHTERYGAAVLKFAQDSRYWIEGLLPKVALTYDEAQLQSPVDTPSLTITMYTIEDMTQSGGAALRAYRAPEIWDGGVIGDTDSQTSEGIDGGNAADNLTWPQPNIDGGTL